MAATPAGNRKIAAKLREKYGVDANGKSVFHTTIGAIGGQNSESGGFRKLKEEDPEKFKELSSRGGKAKRKKHAKA